MMTVLARIRPDTGFTDYARRLSSLLATQDWAPLESLGADLLSCWRDGRQVFLAGNGGSAANAMHLANDFLYGIARTPGKGLRVHALSENPAVISCLANDEGYEQIFSLQLAVQGRADDLLIVLSGSGNSPNILAALEQARSLKMRSYAIVGYSGGQAKQLADRALHFKIDDMQMAEDGQLIAGHMLMQWLHARRHTVET